MGKFFNLSFFKTNGINSHVNNNDNLGNCVLCGKFCLLHRHHVLTRSKGGTSQDTVDVCPSCHDWIHGHPEQAAARGLYLKEYKNEKGTIKTTTD